MSNLDLQSVPKANIEYNAFNLSHRHMTSFNMGRLYPILNMEVLPGDKFNIDIRAFLRFSPLVSPAMNKYDIIIDTYYVPLRILWDNWQDFITGKVEHDPPVIRFTEPFPAGAPSIGSLGDYLGLPTEINTNGVEVSAFPLAAYWKIFDEYYKDQNLTTFPGAYEGLIDGVNTYAGNLSRLPAFKRAWTHDYFTSALPWAQRGEPVQLPLLTGDAMAMFVTRVNNAGGAVKGKIPGTNTDIGAGALTTSASSFTQTGGANVNFDPNNSLEVRIGENAATIRDLRTAFALQSYLERSAVGGQRYREWLYANFGVIDDNASLQRPEFLGRSTGVVTVSEVLSSVQTETDALGRMGGHGISITKENNISYSAKEHGIIISMINVQPEAIYYQGIPKMWSRQTPLDYYLEPFARIGEQEIKNKELYVAGSSLNDLEDTFGYQLRYAEYKTHNHRLSGQFKDSLRFWVAPRTFGNPPALNQEFIDCTPSEEIFAVTNPDIDKIYSQMVFNITALRKMPIEGTPPIM